jgi:2-methylcitrate dehydratase PrpD
MDSMSKPLHSGRAAEAGVAAALMARQGITGSLDVLEGKMGMGVAMGNAPDWAPVLADLGKAFNITEMTFKNHACCGHTFAPIDGALELQRTHGFARGDCPHRGGHLRPGAGGRRQPRTAHRCRSPLQHSLRGQHRPAVRQRAPGRVRCGAAAPPRHPRPDGEGELDGAPRSGPPVPGQRAAQVTIRLHSGQTLRFLQPTRKGDPDMPLTDADLQSKLEELATATLGAERLQAISSRLWQLETAPDLHFL